MVFERYIPELKKYDSISFLHQPRTSGQPLKIVQRHMAHPVFYTNSTVEITLCTVGIIQTLSTQAYEASRSNAQAKKSIF